MENELKRGRGNASPEVGGLVTIHERRKLNGPSQLLSVLNIHLLWIAHNLVYIAGKTTDWAKSRLKKEEIRLSASSATAIPSSWMDWNTEGDPKQNNRPAVKPTYCGISWLGKVICATWWCLGGRPGSCLVSATRGSTQSHAYGSRTLTTAERNYSGREKINRNMNMNIDGKRGLR